MKRYRLFFAATFLVLGVIFTYLIRLSDENVTMPTKIAIEKRS